MNPRRANLNLYVLHMGSTFLDAFTPPRTPAHEIFRDESMLRQGLEQFAGIAGGELFRAQTGVGDNAFARILRETSSYYLLAVEPAGPGAPMGHYRRSGGPAAPGSWFIGSSVPGAGSRTLNSTAGP